MHTILGPIPVQDEGGSERQGSQGCQVPRHARHVRYVRQGLAGATRAHANQVSSCVITFFFIGYSL